MLRRRVDVRFLDHLRMQRTRSRDRRIEIVHFKPEQDAMTGRRRVGVDEIRVILLVPSMKLEDHSTVTKQPFIGIAMLVLWKRVSSEQALIPAAAGPYVAHGNQRL
jgi:hypothetical protein